MRKLIISSSLLILSALSATTFAQTYYVAGSATETGSDIAMTELMPNGSSTGVYESFQRLQVGTYTIKASSADGAEVVYGSDGAGHLVEDGEPFSVVESEVVRIRIDTNVNEIEATAVELYLKGNIVMGGTTVEYVGNGVFSQEVDMNVGTVTLFSDKYFYFAFNNSDALAVKRVSGSRVDVGMPSEGFTTENIRINGGTYTITLDMTNYTWDVDAPIDEYKISAFGSSVCNGQGADNNHGYAYLYDNQLASRYKSGASEYPFTVSGISIGGNTTTDLLNRYDEMLHDFGKYVIIGLSLGNEGIHGASNQQSIFSQFRDNMQKLISMMKEDGKTVVVMNNYARGDFDASDYDYVKRMNILIHQWDVASVNTLGAIDNGSGRWASGYEADTSHPTGAGHRQFMTAIPPSLFDALEQEKPFPVRDMEQSTILDNGSTLSFAGEGTINPYAVTIRFRGAQAGNIISYTIRTGAEAVVSILDDGHIQYVSSAGKTILSDESVLSADDDAWHYITLTGYYAQKRTLLYLDNVCLGEISESVTPLTFTIGDSKKSLSREYSELFFWLSALNETEVEAVVNGTMLKSSLDIYAPLSDVIMQEGAAENLAQSLNVVSFVEGQVVEKIVAAPLASSGEPVYYSVNGSRLPAAERGLTIAKSGNSVVKQLVR